jgi:Protein of unknown function (DUF2752)
LIRFEARRDAFPLGAVFLAIGSLAGSAVGLLHLDRLPLPLCAFKALTGLPCMTCGTTRALGRLFVHDIAGALSMNPLATLAAFAIALWGLTDLLLLSRGRALGVAMDPGTARVVRVLAVLAILVNWGYLVYAGR